MVNGGLGHASAEIPQVGVSTARCLEDVTAYVMPGRSGNAAHPTAPLSIHAYRRRRHHGQQSVQQRDEPAAIRRVGTCITCLSMARRTSVTTLPGSPQAWRTSRQQSSRIIRCRLGAVRRLRPPPLRILCATGTIGYANRHPCVKQLVRPSDRAHKASFVAIGRA